MNVQRFTGRNAREAIAKVRASLGEHAVVLSNRPIPEGVEILAIPGSEVSDVVMESSPPPAAKPAVRAKVEPMSTVSFESYVRERQKQVETPVAAPVKPALESPRAPAAPHVPQQPGRFAAQVLAATTPAAPNIPPAAKAGMDAHQLLVDEMKSMRSMIASQLSSLSWFDTVRRSPIQTRLLRLMLGNGFSPALARHMVGRLPMERNDSEADQWLQDVMSRNLQCVSSDDAILSAGGVYALVGPTGVGKTTTTAKIAAEFALKHGAGAVGLITMDTYRMAASDQLRAFGKLLNIPVHTARDAASLADLLELFDKKKLVLIDTVGASQRDQRLAELFAALPASKVTRLLVLNAAAQAEALDEVVQAYGEGPHTRCVVTKLDEAVTLGGVIDVVVRRRLVVEGIANGQRVPEDWYPARAQLLAERALAIRPTSVFTNDDTELGLLMTAPEIAWMGNTAEASRHA
jgi:flagellar biosynthesis protein FlhF